VVKADLEELAAVAAGAKDVDAGERVVFLGALAGSASAQVVARGHHTSAVFHALRCSARTVALP
jgi:hypothetical protein